MKKSYSAPDIVFESFSLSSSIAACEVETNFNEGNCGYELYPGFIIFMLGVDGCYMQIESNIYADKICYDNPSGFMNLFSS